MSKGTPKGGFLPLQTIMGKETGDYSELSLLGNIVNFRVSQVMDASPLDLDIEDPQTATDWQHLRAMVEAAYRLGLKDGIVQLGKVQ